MLKQSSRVLAVALAAALLATGAEAATLGYSSFYALGDSLTDKGRNYELTAGFEPKSPPYFRGRYTNGPNWFDHVARDFRAEGVRTGAYAFGGAQAATNFDGIPDLSLQRREYLARARKGPDPLVAIWAGANDVIRAVGRNNANSAARDAAKAVGQAAESLHRNGVDTFLIFNLPDLGQTPKFARRDDPTDARRATRATLLFNERLDERVVRLRDRGATVLEVDVYGLFVAMVDDPEAFGVRNVRTPCLRGGKVCSKAQARRRAFFDSLHPNAVIHAGLADAVRAVLAAAAPGRSAAPFALAGQAAPAVAAVPLPAPAVLLLAGIASLGFVTRRRRTRKRLEPGAAA